MRALPALLAALPLAAPLAALYPARSPAPAQSVDVALTPGDVASLERAGAITVVGARPRAHPRRAEALDWSPDGDTVLCVGEEGSLTLWDTATGVLRLSTKLENEAQSEGALSACFDAEGRIVASWSDEVVRFHDPSTLEAVKEIEGILPAGRLAVSADRTFFVKEPYYIPFFAEEDPAAQAFGLDAGSIRAPIEIAGGYVYDVTVSRGGARVAYAGFDGENQRVLGVVDAAGSPVAADGLTAFLETADEFLAEVLEVELSPDGKLLALGAFGVVALYDLDKESLAETLDTSGYRTSALRFSPDGKQLFVGDTSGYLTGIRLRRRGASVEFVQRIHGQPIADLAVSPKGDRVATVERTGTLRLFDVKKRSLLLEPEGPRGPVLGLEFDPRSEALWLGGLDGGVWRASGDGSLEATKRGGALPVRALLRRGADSLLVLDQEGLARLGGVLDHDAAYVPSEEAVVPCADGSADGRTWVYGCIDGRVVVQRAGETVGEVALDGPVAAVALAPDERGFAAVVGDHVFTGSRDSKEVVRVTSEAAEDDVQPTPLAVRFLANDKLAIAMDDESLVVIGTDGSGARTTQLLPDLVFFGGALAAAFSPGAERVATFTDTTGLRVHDVASGELLASIVLEASPAVSIALSADGDRVAVAGADGPTCVFDLSLIGDWANGELSIVDPMVPAEPVIDRALGHEWVAQSAARRKLHDERSYHLERAMSHSVFLPALARDKARLRVARELVQAGVLTKERRALVASIADEWIQLARAYHRKDEPDLARYSLHQARLFDVRPAMEAEAELFGAGEEAQEAPAGAEAGDALPALAFFPIEDGARWEVGAGTSFKISKDEQGVRWTRRAAATEPLADARIRTKFTLDVSRRSALGVLVGVPEAGWGGFGAFVLVDRAQNQLQFWIEDSATRQRLNQRRYSLQPGDAKRAWDLEIEVRGAEIVATLGGDRTLRAKGNGPIRGLFGFAIDDLTGLAGPARIDRLEVTPAPNPVVAKARDGDDADSGAADGPSVDGPERSLQERVDELIAALDGKAPAAADAPLAAEAEGGVLGALLRLGFEAERLADPDARALVRERIDDAVAPRDPLVKRRLKARSSIAELCRKHAAAALEKGFPMTSLAWQRNAERFDPGAEPNREGLGEAEIRAAGVFPLTEGASPRILPLFESTFGASEPVAAGRWEVSGETASSSPGPTDLGMLMSKGRRLGDSFELVVEVKTGRTGIAGLFFDHTGPGGAFSVVTVSRKGWTVVLDVLSYADDQWTMVTTHRLAAEPRSLLDWTPLVLRLDAGVLSVSAGGATPIEIPVAVKRAKGGFGLYAASKGAEGSTARVRFRAVSAKSPL